MRIGQGYDVHRLVEERRLILGGVEIPYEKGLLGHSDADVLVHAVMDALLGAAALGDIGQHFPDTDPAYKGISSIELLKHVGALLEEKGYVVENIDWDDAATQAAYYDQARRWLRNYQSGYVSGDEDILGYYFQPVEADARAYAKEETERLQELISRNLQEDK